MIIIVDIAPVLPSSKVAILYDDCFKHTKTMAGILNMLG